MSGSDRSDPDRELLAHVSEGIPAEALIFRQIVHEGEEARWHNAPRRQFIIQIEGQSEVETSDGTVRRLGPGSITLVEDTTGKGHVTRPCSAGRLTVVITLPDA